MSRGRFPLRRLPTAIGLLGLAWLTASSLAQAQPAASGQGTPPLPAPQMSGRWDFNVQASDPTPSLEPGRGEGEDDRGGRGGRGGGYGGGGSGGRDDYGGRRGSGGRGDEKPDSTAVRQAIDRALEAPRFLIIVQHPDSIHLTDDEGWVTTLRPDGTKVTEQLAGGAVERTTKWEDRTLVTTAKLTNGARITQRFTKVFDGLQLEIATKIEGGKLRRPIEFKRVYDQAFQ